MADEPLSLHMLPLFPLGAVLFPGGVLPLRVFELRYLDMVTKCHKAGAPFGVVALLKGSEVQVAGAPQEQLHAVGTLARITALQKPQSGLILAECAGAQRFRIAKSQRLKNGLWVADVDLLPADTAVAIPADLQTAAQALRQLHATLHARGDRGADAAASNYDDCGWVSNRWCELLPITPQLKQRLMVLDNPLVRLELVADILLKTGIGQQAS